MRDKKLDTGFRRYDDLATWATPNPQTHNSIDPALRTRIDSQPKQRNEVPMAYDPNNIFAKILRGEIPCHKLYEDEDTLAFLDIMPRSEGHALVITKTQARDLFDIAPAELAKVMAVVKKLAPQIRDAVGADGVLIAQFNGEAAGQTVFHLHVHIIPRKEGVELKPPEGKMEDQAKLTATAEKIRKAVS
jgi:histidine triad (HIT) family protein